MAARSIPKNQAAPFYFKGGKTAVLLIHGFTGTPFIFRELGTELAKAGYTVSAPLIAGHGTSPDDLEKTKWRDWYTSITEAYDQLAHTSNKIFVVGASFGGILACRLVAERPVAGLILIGVPRWIYKHFLIVILTPILLLLKVRYYNKPIGKAVDSNAIFGGPNFSYLKIPMKSVAQLLELLGKLNETLLAKIKVPTLIVQSTRDGLVKPQSGKFLFNNVASEHKQLVWIEEQHHELHSGKGRRQIYSLISEFIVRW